MNIICNEEWVTAVRTSLPLDSNKISLFITIHTLETVWKGTVLFTYWGNFKKKVPRSPLKSKNRALSSLDKEE